MHQTQYWHCVEEGEKSSLTIFVQTCAQGQEKLSKRNHVVQNLRVYFVPYVITIKCACACVCVGGAVEVSSMSATV